MQPTIVSSVQSPYGRRDLRRFQHFAHLSAVFRYTLVQKLLDDFEGHASVFLLSVAGMER